MKRVLFVATAFYCASLLAGPAPWYRWHSRDSDIDVCSQTSPGDGWVIVKGPYKDAVCKKPGVPN
jgi:hypothetical protein